MSTLSPDASEQIARTFGISNALVKEIEFINDERWWNITPEQRWRGVRKWINEQLKETTND